MRDVNMTNPLANNKPLCLKILDSCSNYEKYYNEFKFTEDIFNEDKNAIIRTSSLTVGDDIYFPPVVK